MADEKENAEQPVEAEPASSGNMLLVIGLAVSILFGLAGFGAAGFMFMNQKPVEEPITVSGVASDAAHAEEDELYAVTEEDELDEGEEALGAIYPLESFVLNLSGGRYLRAQLRLEFEGREVPKRFFPRIVPVRDLIIQLLSVKRAEDLLTSQGKEGLKGEIKDKVNELLRREDIKNVYFSQFVVQ